MDIEAQLKELADKIQNLESERIGKTSIIPGSIQQIHMANSGVVQFGKDADRPKVGSNSVLAFFAYDTKKLYLWNPTSNIWNYVQFT